MKNIFERLREGLGKTRDNFTGKIDALFNSLKVIDDDFYEELEDLLILSDVGYETTMEIMESLEKTLKNEKVRDAGKVKGILKSLLAEKLNVVESAKVEVKNEGLRIILIIGVNGVGKTTTIGKLASKFTANGEKVIVAAADTFRAAAVEQLKVWVERANCDLISQKEGADPASVVYDAIQAAKARKMDLLICDTAGRLHNKKNLMNELNKITKIIKREAHEASLETYLVLDATTGQNALNQAKAFSEITDISGIVMTKLDGTAKGGIVFALVSELGLPVKYIGVGEGIEDLQKFDAESFINAIF
ncbi:MAG: signal recognition particle-docking protein FtsY [Peptostreptococcaceae bacterium]|nr:signal recognition particle-docking protein FtsY [Peptostreptococcaceae bacterium]